MATEAGVGLRAILSPEVDERETEREVSKIEEIIDDRDFSISPAIDTARDAVGTAARTGAQRALPGRIGTRVGSVLDGIISPNRQQNRTGGTDRTDEGPTDRESGESLVDLAIERNELLQELVEEGFGGEGGEGGDGGGRLTRLLGLGGLGAIGAMGVGVTTAVGARLIDFLRNYEWPKVEVPEINVPKPDWLPVTVVKPDWLPFNVPEPDWLPFEVPEIDIPEPGWLPIEVLEPGETPGDGGGEDPTPEPELPWDPNDVPFTPTTPSPHLPPVFTDGEGGETPAPTPPTDPDTPGQPSLFDQFVTGATANAELTKDILPGLVAGMGGGMLATATGGAGSVFGGAAASGGAAATPSMIETFNENLRDYGVNVPESAEPEADPGNRLQSLVSFLTGNKEGQIDEEKLGPQQGTDTPDTPTLEEIQQSFNKANEKRKENQSAEINVDTTINVTTDDMRRARGEVKRQIEKKFRELENEMKRR